MIKFILKIFGLIKDDKHRYTVEYSRSTGRWIIVEIIGVKKRKIGIDYPNRTLAINALINLKR